MGVLGRGEQAVACRRLALGLLAAALLVVAGCAPRRAPPAPPPPPPPEAPRPPEPPREEDRHRVAVLVPLSGPNAAVGQSIAHAVTLALADSGSTRVRFTTYDTAAEGAAAAAARALGEGAGLILGPLLAADIPAVRAAAEPRRVPVLSFSNDASLAGGVVWILGFQPAQAVERVVAQAVAQGRRRFAALVPNGTYGERAAVALTRAVAAQGGEVAAITRFTRAREALPAAARRVAGWDQRLKAGSAGQPAPPGFDALLIADSGPIAGAFTPQLARYGVRAPDVLLLGTELWAADPGIVRVPGLQGALFAAVPDTRFRMLAARYRARFGGNPSRLASLGYDAALLAIGAAGRWSVGEPLPTTVLADGRGFSGVDGIFRFRGQVAERGLEVRQVTPQGFRVVSPAPSAFAGAG
ncbi:MAG: penicillin-binding protein activator [Sphingomonadaceae bacterium]|nr:penicillin-binding protein activator [Sphingomonadaceae bacterium]